MALVTVLGGYGIFGCRVAEALARHPGCRVRVAGRNARAGNNCAGRLGAEFHACDVRDRDSLRRAVQGSAVVVHAAGPFQDADYRVAEACLQARAHYLDLADGRAFVAGIRALDAAARERGLLVLSGASSTPAVTSALVGELAPAFAHIDEIQTALSPGNQNPRGAATVAAVLSYLGRPIRVWQHGVWVNRPGWGDARRLDFPRPVGRRRVHNCDVPELELFPAAFTARTVRFFAGLELGALNYLLSACAWPCRWFGLRLESRARLFLNLSLMLYPFGSTNGSLAVWVRGRDHCGAALERRIALVTDYDGPATPSAAATILTKRILRDGPPRVGAFACVGFLTLAELVDHLRPLGVWCTRGDESGWHAPAPDAGTNSHFG